MGGLADAFVNNEDGPWHGVCSLHFDAAAEPEIADFNGSLDPQGRNDAVSCIHR